MERNLLGRKGVDATPARNGTSLCGSRVDINMKRGDVLFESA
jgi:hypothetical protein